MTQPTSPLAWRFATEADLPALSALMTRSIEALQADLSPEQVKASHLVMGLDRQLIADRSYVLVELDGTLAGCGGWSRRSTLFGGDDSVVARAPQLLDPARDPARIRAMYCDPAFARRGVGRFILATCEGLAREAGFARVEMMATLAGEHLYAVCGYQVLEEVTVEPVPGVTVPMKRMGKAL